MTSATVTEANMPWKLAYSNSGTRAVPVLDEPRTFIRAKLSKLPIKPFVAFFEKASEKPQKYH
jgi:hypothetical protein